MSEQGTRNRRRFLREALGYLGLGGLALHTAGRASSAAPRVPLDRDAYVNEVRALRQVDPSLIHYHEVEPIEPGLKRVWDMAVDRAGRLLLVGDKSLRILDREGNLLSRIALPAAGRCVTQDVSGQIFVGLTRRVEIYDPEGARLARWDPPHTKALFTAIAVSEDHVFLADAGNRRIWHYDRSGELRGSVEGKFVVPSPYFDLAIASDGTLKVANPGQHRIETYTLDGKFVSSWGKFSRDVKDFFGCCNPVNFALLQDGRFVTAEKGIPRVKIYHPDGHFECVVAAPGAFPRKRKRCTSEDPFSCRSRGLDVAVDPEERILVYDPTPNMVRVFQRKPTS